jgi:RHS repeat-associated protein
VTVTAPAGWTLQNSTADPASNVRDLLYWRIAATSDPTSWTWTFSSTIKVSGGIGAYAGVNQTNPIDTSAVTTSGSSTTLVAPSVTTTKDNAMVVVLYGTRTGTTLTPPAGMSERYDQASTGQSAATRTTSEAADQAQPAAGVSGTRTATAAASVTASVNRTIALAPAPIVTTVRYGYSGGGDSPDLTLDATNAVVERTFALFGGVSLTKRAGGDVWSYPNIHGDVIATADATGAKQGQTLSYDPYGQALGGLPDNSAGNLDYGWLGQHQRPLEHEGTLATIEMGDRQYLPGLGRFIEVDPIEGGSANNYEYAAGDPVNDLDLDGKMCFVRCGWAKAARKVVTNPIFQVGFVAAACGFGTPVACAIANAGVAAWSSTDRFKRQGINRGTIASAGVDAMFALGRTVTFAPLPRASFVPLSSRLAATGMNAALASMFTIDRMAVGALFGY